MRKFSALLDCRITIKEIYKELKKIDLESSLKGISGALLEGGRYYGARVRACILNDGPMFGRMKRADFERGSWKFGRELI